MFDYPLAIKNLSLFFLLRNNSEYSIPISELPESTRRKMLAMVNASFSDLKIKRDERIKILNCLFDKPIKSSSDLLKSDAIALYRIIHTDIENNIIRDDFYDFCWSVLDGR